MRLKASKSTILLLGAVLGLVVTACGGLLWLQSSALARSSAVLRTKEGELSDGKMMVTRRDAARASLEADRNQLQFLETSVSDAAFVPTLLKQIEDLAKKTQNRVQSVRPQQVVEAPKTRQRRDPAAEVNGDGKPKNAGEQTPEDAKKAEPYTPLSIQVSLIGHFKSVEAFVDQLTRFPKIVAVEEVSLRPHHQSGDKGDSGVLDADLKLTAFVMKQDSAPARPGAPGPLTASARLNGGTQQ